MSGFEFAELWGASAAGTVGADLRDCNRQHGVCFADQRVRGAARPADFRRFEPDLFSRLGLSATAMAAVSDQYSITVDQQFDDGKGAPEYHAERGTGSGAVDSRSFGGRRKNFSLAGCNGSSWF